MAGSNLYDVIIVGAGPAGLAAGLYAARDRYKTLLLERSGLPGGQIMLTEHVENYPGYLQVPGPELIEQMKQQVERFGAEIATGQAVTSLKSLGKLEFEVGVNNGEKTYRSRAIILAPGSDYRQLGVPGEADLRQAGKVSYCATCDGAFYRDKHVLAVGGGNTAVEDTVYLATRFTKKITLVHRRREFRAQKVLVEQLYETAGQKDIDIKLPYVLAEIVGNADGTEIDHVKIKNVETDKIEELKVDGVFVFVGMRPNTSWLRGVTEIDEAGYIAADPLTMKTPTAGVFVAGDCRRHAAMQLATACSDGVIAAMQLKAYYQDPITWGCETCQEQTGGW